MLFLRTFFSGICFFSLNCAYADQTIYELPSIGASASPPFLYSQSPELGNQVIISNSQIIRSGANNIGELINNVAGIQYTSGFSADPQILIHSEPAMILVNGVPLTNFSMSNPDINLIPLSEIKQIVITPGVEGTTYGNQSLGGVVNIITKSPHDAEKSLTLAMGAPWMNQVIGTIAGPLNNANFYQLDAQNEFDSGYRDNNQQNITHADASFEHDDALGSVTTNVDIMRQLLQFPGYLTDVQVAQNSQQSIASQEQGTYQANTGLIGFNWNRNLNSLWQAQTNLSLRAQDAASDLGGNFDQDYRTATLAPELKGQFQAFNRPINASIGLMLSEETYSFQSPTFSASNITGANQQQYSTYGSLDIPLTHQLSLTGSGRLLAVETAGQFYNDTTFQYNPESTQSQNLALATLGLSDQVNQDTAVYIRRAMGYQLPFIDESNFTANPNTGFGLQATTSTAYETGLNWQGNALQFNTEAFLINLQNEIGFFSPPNGIAANYNLAPTRRQGVSVDGNYQATNKWDFGASLTLMNNYFRQGIDSGDEIPGASDVLGDINARYQINQIWSLYGESEYTGTQYAQGDNANVTSKIPGYWVDNIAVEAQFSAWQLSLRLNNITNNTYYLTTVYNQFITAPHNNDVAYYPAPGRNFMLSLNYNFE